MSGGASAAPAVCGGLCWLYLPDVVYAGNCRVCRSWYTVGLWVSWGIVRHAEDSVPYGCGLCWLYLPNMVYAGNGRV